MKLRWKITPNMWGLILASFVLVLISVLGLLTPSQEYVYQFLSNVTAPVRSVIQPIKDNLAFLGDIQGISRENEVIKVRVQELENMALDYSQLAEENKWLQEQLQITSADKVNPGYLVKVIPGSRYLTPGFLTIETGGTNIVQVGSLVSSKGFIVGRVKSINEATATVELITADSFSLPVKVQGHIGVLEGNLGLDFEVHNVDTGAEVKTGDKVMVTDGDLIAGYVDQVKRTEIDPTLSISLVSPLNFSSLDYLLVDAIPQ